MRSEKNFKFRSIKKINKVLEPKEKIVSLSTGSIKSATYQRPRHMERH